VSQKTTQPREAMTVSLDAALVRQLKQGAAEARRPLSWYVEDIIRQGQAREHHAPTRSRGARA